MQKEIDKEWVLVVPKFIIGLAVIFWGIMIEQELLGIFLAILLEAHHFVSTRWHFSFSNYVKAWHLSVIFAIFGGVLYWMDGYKVSEMRVMFQWLPLVFSPLMFVQNFGEDDCLPLNTFSLMARHRMKADIKEGRTVRPTMINFGAPFLGMVLLSAGLMKRTANFWDVFSVDVTLFYTVGLLLIVAIFLYLVGRRNGRGIISFLFIYGVMILIGSTFLTSLTDLELRFRGGGKDLGAMEMEQSITRIGKLGELKQSKKIHWRMWVPESKKAPELVPLAVYDSYMNGTWLVSDLRGARNNNIYTRGVTDESGKFTYFHSKNGRELVKQSAKDAYRFVSTIETNKSQTLMPHLPKNIGFSGLVGKEAFLEKNRLGSIRIVNLDATLQVLVYTSDKPGLKHSLVQETRDLRIPFTEKKALAQLVEDLDLKAGSGSEKVNKLRDFFNREFSYTTHLDTTATKGYRGENVSSALSNFLLKSKKGHCEYFATATTLLLRQAGIPARYVIGYSVGSELADGAHVLRGTQAHAWCQAWIDGEWKNVDLTPPDWHKQDSDGMFSWQTKIADKWKTLREDFQVWRNAPENAEKVNIGIFVVLGALVLWIFIRLWFAKNKNGRGGKEGKSLPPWKIMKRFDKWCSTILGPRPVALPYGEWVEGLESHLPDEKDLIQKFVKAYRVARFAGDDSQLDTMNESVKKLMALKVDRK